MKKILCLISVCVFNQQLIAQLSFAPAATYAVGNNPVWVTAADLKGGGKVDLISANYSANTLSVLTNTGSGGFVLASSPSVGSGPYSVVAADLNGDGEIELICVNTGDSTLSVLTNNGNGSYVSAATYAVGSAPEGGVAADVNGDGKPDLICADKNSGSLSVLTNNGSGGFTLASSPGAGSQPEAVVSVDVNGDGYVDLVCANAGGANLTVLTNNGSGGFVTAGTYAVGSNPNSLTTADVNGDGKVDLISANYGANTLSVLTNDGSGGFVLAATLVVGSGPQSVAAADVNGDGKVDLISANQNDNTLSVFTNNGSGGFVLAAVLAVGSGPQSVAAADVNGDGKPDLICANNFNNTLSVLLNTSPFPAHWPIITSQPQSQAVVQGKAASFAVTATGSAPLTYQWLFFGTNISSATNSSLTFASIQLTNAGNYTVMVSNNLGFTNSANAVLQVLPPDAPSIQVNGMLAVGTVTAIASAQVTISGGFDDGYIFYTLDGSVPSVDSTLYGGAFIVSNSVTVQAMSLSEDLSRIAYAPEVQVQITTQYSLQTSVVGSGTITANPSTGPYLSNSVVVLTATPATNWLFAYWTNNASGNQNPLSLTMNGPQNVQAVFLPIPFYSLQTSVAGSGTITANPPTGPYLSNSVVTLTATPAQNWLFAYWTNNATGSQNPLSLTMDGPQSAQAVFIPTYPVTASTLGGGSVTVNGQVIAPATYYPAGSTLTLAATPNSGWSFLGWQGNASGVNNPLSVTVNGTNNIQAIFGTVVATNAVGSGEIVLNLPNPVPYGTTITASAVPNAGKYFVTWSGAASGTNSPTQITVTSANPAVSALFTTLPGGNYSLGVVVLGNGSVAINPQQNYYTAGASVTLRATPVPGVTSFYGWTQDASGTNSPIEVVMNSNQIVEASFGALPIVSVSPLNLFVAVGSNAVLTANAAGLPPLSYQWQDSQGLIAGATNASFTIANAQATNAGNYSVIVSNPFGSVTSVAATVTVVFPPSISSQPANQIVAAGTSLILSVSVSGTPPLNYQWQNSSGPIPGQTNSSLILNPALTNYTDNYSVIASNPYGAATSELATAFVYLPVSILSQPASLVVPYFAPATFGVTAYGFPSPASYQWTLNGTNLVGANSSTLTINSVRLANTGSYQVQVGNGYSSTNSYPATLDMSPSITSPFSGAAAIWGSGTAISVGAIGSGTLTYQWYLNGLPIAGATGSTLDFASIQFTNAGLYSVVVSSPYGGVTNVAAQVIVNPAGVALGFSPTVVITGTTGYSYTIQRSANLADTNAWETLASFTLTQPVLLWVDTNVDVFTALNSKYFYRVLPGQ